MLLPGTVAVVVPAVLVARDGAEFEPLRVALGRSAGARGFAMWVWTVRLFARIGRGTLAPWDPTERLVVEGPYAHVRNPMITGVLAVLLGEALIFGSTAIAIWAAIFAVVNHVFFLASRSRRSSAASGRNTAATRRTSPAGSPAVRRTFREGPGSSVDRAAAF